MKYQKTILVAALMTAFSATSQAADWEEAPLLFDGTNEAAMIEQYTAFVYNDKGWTSGFTNFEEDKIGYVTSKNLTQTNGTPNYGGAPVFLQSNDQNTEVVNAGKIWVVGNSDLNGDYVAEAMGTSGSSTEQSVTNTGFIYVDGQNGKTAYSRIKGMSAINGRAINEGTIVVRNGGVAMIDNTATGADGTKSLINKGTITVLESDSTSIGIYYRKNSNAIVSNEGTITTFGENSIGVRLGYDVVDVNDKVFTNTGIISSVDGKAIQVDDWVYSATLNFENASSVSGVVDANAKTTLNFVNNTDTIELADDAKAIKVDKTSHITIEQATQSGLNIGSLTSEEGSTTAFRLSRLGTNEDKVLTIGSVTGELTVGYSGDVSDALVQGGDVENLFNGLDLGEYSLNQVTVDEGTWGDALLATQTPDGNVTTQTLSQNSLLTSATDVALTSALMWRTQLSSISDRLGTLRTMPQSAGSWARYNNGRLEGRDLRHDYNTIELGVDAPVSSNFVVGLSFDYTFADTDLRAGQSDSNTYAVGLYGSYFADNGSFVDMMAKIGRIDADYDLNNGIREKADYMMTGAVIGIEGGHRFDLNDRFFVEPQIQLSYSWLRASSYTTDIRTVDLDTMESLIARAGIMGGVKFAENRGNAYLKASYNHDFLGDVDASFSGNGYHRSVNEELDDNWGEVSLGASYQLSNSFNAFVDLGTSFGGDIDQKWRVNLGGRYTF